jgi:hypothetical protein
MPVTTPAPFTIAIAGLLLLHTPPGVAFPNNVVVPGQIGEVVPVISAATGMTLTVITRVVVAEPQIPVTV